VLQRFKTAIAVRRLSPVARAVRTERLTYLVPEKLLFLEQAMRRAQSDKVPGDFLEFGVALGGGSIVIATEAKAQGRRFAGFDVFATIPAPTSEKDDEKSKARYAIIAEGKSKGIGGDKYYGYRPDLYGDVVRSFKAHGLVVDDDKIRLVKGLFDQTWPSSASERIAFAHLDCDWYDPVRYCLGAVADRLSTGGVMMLDDYYAYGGCRTATDEFRAERRDFRFENGPSPILRKVA
jgi:asparagine synthase (glutamine-hydrolysing)